MSDHVVHALASTVRSSRAPAGRARRRNDARNRLRQRFVADAGRSPRRRKLRAASLPPASFGMPRALQIEDLLRVDRGDGRAVAADDVVGEDLELGLRVHLRLRRQEHGLRLHRAVGLLRAWRDDDLALKDARPPRRRRSPGRIPGSLRAARRARPRASYRPVAPPRAAPVRRARSSRPRRSSLAKICRRDERAARHEAKSVQLRLRLQCQRAGFRDAAPARRRPRRRAELRALGEPHRRRGVTLDGRRGAEKGLDHRRARRPRGATISVQE